MAARTYVPQFRRLLQDIARYLARWTPLLLPHLTTEEVAALLTFQAALNAMIATLGAIEELP